MKNMINSDNSKTFNEIYDRSNNAFDIVRLILAIFVIYSHSYPLFGRISGGDILTRITDSQIDFGALAIYCFFIISGFLITQSLLNSKGYLEYLKKRCLRIFPALIFSTLLFSLVLGPIISNYSLKEYYNDSVGSYIIDSITLNITGFYSTINDVFSTNPYPSAINGSAWSLKHEFACYIIIIVLHFFYFYRHKLLLIVTTLDLCQ